MTTSGTHDSIERVRGTILLQLKAARGLLDPARDPNDADVHEARKAIKRGRALVRLLRYAIAPRALGDVNGALRDAGRCLSAARDAKVLEETLAAVVTRDSLPSARARRLRARVGGASDAAPALDPRARRAACALLDRAVHRVSRLRPRQGGAQTLDRGLERIRRRGARAMRSAREERTAEALHEWRKQVQNYWHALEAHPGRVARSTRERIETARKLSRALGEDHDLALLERRLGDAKAARGRDHALRRSIARRRARRQRAAIALGKALYRDRR